MDELKTSTWTEQIYVFTTIEAEGEGWNHIKSALPSPRPTHNHTPHQPTHTHSPTPYPLATQSNLLRLSRCFHGGTFFIKSSVVFNSLRKHAYSNIKKISPPKTENFQIKNSDIFHISAQNIDCGYSLEPPRRGGSNEYPQSMF